MANIIREPFGEGADGDEGALISGDVVLTWEVIE